MDLRRLLRRAGLSYTIVYGQRATGTAAVQEGRVFEATAGEREMQALERQLQALLHSAEEHSASPQLPMEWPGEADERGAL